MGKHNVSNLGQQLLEGHLGSQVERIFADDALGFVLHHNASETYLIVLLVGDSNGVLVVLGDVGDVDVAEIHQIPLD